MRDLRRLHFFVTVAELGNVSRASEVLHISQSALSRQIQALEEELGFHLFDRVGKRLVLTTGGEELLPRAAALLEQADALSLRADAVARGRIGHLRIGATPQTIAALIAPALTRFRAEHPGVEITLIEGHNRALIEMVERGTVHLSIASPGEQSPLRTQPLFMAELLAYLPPDDPRASLATLALETLDNAPMLVLRRGFMTRDLFDQSCQAAGIRTRIVLESDSPFALVAMVEAGHGIAMLSSSAASGIRTHRPIRVSAGGIPARRLVSAVWNPERHRPAALPPLIRCLADHAASRAQAPPGPAAPA